ncbi:hypothetical protein [Alicycliphilus denitrificans]|uniref:hypothetical protein n=1 Tax=Alicycliphilus denitrificans TaxID=179636 RepID=UPI0001DA0DE7|nr:hypothetical protein [Alicycliphilus denitrificans]ADV01283.1 Hsp70 family chaperone Lhs1/Orp150, putative [Alicycliphilus denitrificans BC]
MNDHELRADLDGLQGQLLATQAIVRSLLMSHPDPRQAIEAAHAEVETLAALALARNLSDALNAGIEQARKATFPSARDFRGPSGQ